MTRRGKIGNNLPCCKRSEAPEIRKETGASLRYELEGGNSIEYSQYFNGANPDNKYPFKKEMISIY